MRAKRRINSTGRRRINRESIDIRMLEAAAGGPLKAEAKLDLAPYKFPADALVSIEAYHRSSGMRFPCGTVGSTNIPPVLVLDEIDQSGPILFRVKVTDTGGNTGQLLGSAERIQPLSEDEDKDRRALFPVLYRSLGEQVWKVDINPGDRPKLVINRDIPGIRHRLANDPFMKGMLFPAAFRIVMEALARTSGDDDEDDDAESAPWQADWLKFCAERLGIAGPPSSALEDREKWIEDAVTGFAGTYGFVKEIRKQEEEA
jgi:hypothetical protein